MEDFEKVWKNKLCSYVDKDEQIKRLISLTDGKELFLFGAGVGGARTFAILEENKQTISCFVDNNKRKYGAIFCGRAVISPDEMLLRIGKTEKFHVIITAGEGTAIMRQLRNLGIDERYISIFDTSQICGEISNRDFIIMHENKISEVFGLLSDTASKEVLLGLLNYRLTLDFAQLSNIFDPDEEQYFAQDLIRFSGEEVFLDAGTYDGETVKEYIKRCNDRYKKIICFEADNNNVGLIKQNFLNWGVHDFEIYTVGLWNEETTLHFDAIGSGSGRISDEGKTEIVANSIDNVLQGMRVDFIKMDIEGAEYRALQGAVKAIDVWKPTLAISIYHYPNDIFEIPLFIHQVCPEYKFYMRHYRQFSGQETILYAIAEGKC